jgi:hypothetical protein
MRLFTLQAFVEPLSLFRDRTPTKMFFDAFAASFSESLA